MQEMDDVYALSYMRTYHPSYEAAGGVPAIREVKFSLVSNRGCFGGCSFCALTFHQGSGFPILFNTGSATCSGATFNCPLT